MFLQPNCLTGFNVYSYCYNDPINLVDKFGQFALTISMILVAIGIGAAVGAASGFISSIAQDAKNGKIFDGDVTWKTYLGRTLGGGVAGAGIGLCTILGAGVGAAVMSGTALTIGATTVSGGVALAIGLGTAFVTGGLGYATQTGISDQENFEWTDCCIEASANMLKGLVSFGSAMIGGITGTKIPGARFKVRNVFLFQLSSALVGAQIYKYILIPGIKKRLKEKY